jgi:hypothetical protein
MDWTLSDGTIVSLGGRVRGDSSLAEFLRGVMGDARKGRISSGYGVCPHYETLDVGVPHLLDFWLRENANVTSGPDVEYPKHDPRPEPTPGSVY